MREATCPWDLWALSSTQSPVHVPVPGGEQSQPQNPSQQPSVEEAVALLCVPGVDGATADDGGGLYELPPPEEGATLAHHPQFVSRRTWVTSESSIWMISVTECVIWADFLNPCQRSVSKAGRICDQN